MHASEVTEEAARRANELYWDSERSVNQIADELDLSKGALYGVITPLPSGMFCPMCADEVAYPNRTARDRGMLLCPTCDWEGSSSETVDYEDTPPALDDDAADDGRAEAPGPAARAPRSSRSRSKTIAEREADVLDIDDDAGTPTPLLTPRMRTIAGGALIGAAVGLALVLWARRR